MADILKFTILIVVSFNSQRNKKCVYGQLDANAWNKYLVNKTYV